MSTQQKKEHSEEDYKKAVKILKVKLQNLQSKTQNLEQKYVERISKYKLTPLELAMELQQDENYKEIQLRPYSRKIYDFAPYENERILRTIFNHISKKGITFEMMFRCADSETCCEIAPGAIKDFLIVRMGVTFLSELEITKVISMFDEDCNGSISWDEYKTVLCRYSINQEGDYLTDARNSDKQVFAKLNKFFEHKMRKTPEVIYQEIADTNGQTNFITGQNIQSYFDENDLIIKDQELYAILRIMDPERKNQVRKMDFIRELTKIQNNEVDIEIEMKKFKEYFRVQNIKPTQVYKIADKDNLSEVSVKVLANTVVQFIKNISFEETLFFLNLIGKDPISIIEFELSLLTEDDIDGQKPEIYAVNLVGFSDKEEVMTILNELLEELNLKPGQLFKRLDRNLSGEISLVELRSGLIDLGLTLENVLKVLRVFDKDFNGQIEVQEFMDQFENTEEKEKQDLVNQYKYVNVDYENDKRLLVDAVKKLRKVFVAYYPQLSLQHQQLFQKFDRNNDGRLSRQEFIEGLDSLEAKANLVEKQKQILIRYCDQDENNIIDFEEFVEFLEHFEENKIREDRLRNKRKQEKLVPIKNNFIIQKQEPDIYDRQLQLQGDLDDFPEADKSRTKLVPPPVAIITQDDLPTENKQTEAKGNDDGDFNFEEEDMEKGDNQRQVDMKKKEKNIDLDSKKDEQEKLITIEDSQKKSQVDIEAQKPLQLQEQQQEQYVPVTSVDKPKRTRKTYIFECIFLVYLVLVIIVGIVWLTDLNQNKNFKAKYWFKTKSVQDITDLYFEKDDNNERDVAIVIQKNLSQYFPSVLDYVLILASTTATVAIFGADLTNPPKWKYLLNLVLMGKDAFTVIWLFKEEIVDNETNWSFPEYGYFLGRTVCSIPFFLTLSKILTLRLYVFCSEPGCIIRYILNFIYFFSILFLIAACMHFTIGCFVFLIPVFPIWSQFQILFYFLYTNFLNDFKQNEQVDEKRKKRILENEQLVKNFDAFSIRRCGVLTIYAVLIPQVIMAGAIISDENANFPGFWQYFYSSSLQILANVYSINTDNFDFLSFFYRYTLGF